MDESLLDLALRTGITAGWSSMKYIDFREKHQQRARGKMYIFQSLCLDGYATAHCRPAQPDAALLIEQSPSGTMLTRVPISYTLSHELHLLLHAL